MDIRQLLYPIGFLASITFGARLLSQWLQSEIKGKSVVTSLFWQLSLLGNLLLLIHSFVQIQYPICLVQGFNMVISWRNLNLMSVQPFPLKSVFGLLALAPTLITIGFLIQGFFLLGHADWVRTPTMPWASAPAEKLSLAWHIFGTSGIVLFASRFWIQWWLAEKKGYSTLGASFWWSSLIGALLGLVYFVRLQDTVNILGMSLGVIPYIRNILLPKERKGT
jgi:lipid-A-disaccharide synthase-like uncharacterized protein